jgi:ribonuclease D
MPPENLLAPDGIRRLAWEPPVPVGPAEVRATLAGYGARDWQLDLTAEPLTAALTAPASVPGAPAPETVPGAPVPETVEPEE